MCVRCFVCGTPVFINMYILKQNNLKLSLTSTTVVILIKEYANKNFFKSNNLVMIVIVFKFFLNTTSFNLIWLSSQYQVVEFLLNVYTI